MDLAKTLFEHGHMSAEQLIAIRQHNAHNFSTPVRAIQDLKILSDDLIPIYFRLYFNIQNLDNAALQNLDERYSELIPEDLAIHLRVFCVGGYKQRLLVAMEDPSDLSKRHQIEFFLAKKIVPVAASKRQIDFFLQKYYKNTNKLTLATNLNKEVSQQDEVPPPKKETAPSEKENTSINEEPVEALATKISISNENSAASHVEPKDIPKLNTGANEEPLAFTQNETDNAQLVFQVNSALVKFGFCKNRIQALEALNAKIASSSLVVSLEATAFVIKTKENVTISIEFKSLNESQNNIAAQILLPALKRIIKFA